MKYITSTLAAIFLAGGLATATQAEAAKDTVIIYDASGSMWGQIDNVSKVEIARDVMTNLINKWDNSTHLGLVAYGHRSKGDCADIETLVEPGPLDKTKFIKTINDINPKGKTPISASLQHAAELLSYRDSQASVVLISDGIETCNADPCAVAKQLAAQGVNFTAHVVGFDIESDDHASLACIAENTGGLFVPASNATELHAALAQVQDAMEQPASEPEPEPEPSIPEVAITGPQQVTAGATFDVQWSQNINKSDMVTIVPSGAKEGTHGNYKRVGDSNQTSLTAPADTGLYELRYILNEGGKTLATADIEVTDTEVTITGPQQVTAGATFDVQWSQNINKSDMITIVPSGAKEGTHGNYKRVGDNNQTSLTAPAETGLYELRYILNAGGKTVATADIEVTAPEVNISAPEVVRAGGNLEITWSTSINNRDMVTILPLGSKEGARGNYKRVGNNTAMTMTAPSDTGLYEVRYIMDAGHKTLATAPLEVVAATASLDAGVGLSVPASAAVGEVIEVTWTHSDPSKDQRIALARSSQADFTWISAQSIAEENSIALTMPEQKGFYEVRFIDISEREVLARSIIEVK
ncbi:MAG TPA: VWA domain-containing protein [Thiopseudomonas sp.]|nr:VWA domain-containing protein [Thiopseudomonas sp.]